MTFESSGTVLARPARVALVALFVAGCATRPEIGKLDPALFLRMPGPPERTANLQIAVVADPASTQFMYEWAKGSPRLFIPVGEIVEAATVAALTDELGMPVVQYPSAEAATKGSAPGAPTAIVVARPGKFEVHDEVIPLFLFYGYLPIQTREDVRLIVDWQVLDADGNPLWTKRYDSGDVKYTEIPRDRTTSLDRPREQRFYVQLAHQAAYMLMREAARDLRGWIEAERLRERVL